MPNDWRIASFKNSIEKDSEGVISACSNKFGECYSVHDRQKIWQCDKDFFFSTDRFNLPFCIEPSRPIRCRVVQTSFFSLALVWLEAWPGYEQGPIGSFLYQRAKPPQGIVLFINLLGKGLTPRACMGDAGSIWWVPDTRDYLVWR